MPKCKMLSNKFSSFVIDLGTLIADSSGIGFDLSRQTLKIIAQFRFSSFQCVVQKLKKPKLKLLSSFNECDTVVRMQLSNTLN